MPIAGRRGSALDDLFDDGGRMVAAVARTGKPEEVAVFLAAEEAGFITGTSTRSTAAAQPS